MPFVMDRNTITEVLIGNSPGFISSDVVPPSRPKSNEWTMVLNFRSQDELTAWQRSSERAEIVGEDIPLFEGGSLGEVAQPDRPGEPPGLNVTERLYPFAIARAKDRQAWLSVGTIVKSETVTRAGSPAANKATVATSFACSMSACSACVGGLGRVANISVATSPGWMQIDRMP